MKIYTRLGDKGNTSMISLHDIPKDHPSLEAIGTLDELSSWLGYIIIKVRSKDRDFLEETQKDIYKLSAYIAGGRKPLIDPRVKNIEIKIDEIEDALPLLSTFIYPGGTEVSSIIHIARSICRRAERKIVRTQRKGLMDLSGVITYVNRLSDYLFVLARQYNHKGYTEKLLK